MLRLVDYDSRAPSEHLVNPRCGKRFRHRDGVLFRLRRYMPKVINIEESKIVTKSGLQMQRVIFSDDRIVYVRLEDGEVYPKDVPDKYVDLINAYNATHDSSNFNPFDFSKPEPQPEPKADPNEFWGNKEQNYIKDGSPDRRNQIERAQSKRHLSKNRDTQNAINRIRGFGTVLLVSGILQIVISVLYLVFVAYAGAPPDVIAGFAAICILEIIVGGVFSTFGSKIRGLEIEPSTIRGVAIATLILYAINLLFITLGIGLVGLLIIVYAIITLFKVGRYEDWFYGEIE